MKLSKVAQPALSLCSAVVILAACGSQSTLSPSAITRDSFQRHAERSTATYSVLLNFDGRNGAYPNAKVIVLHGMLYGMTPAGGRGCKKRGCGTVFSVTTTGDQDVIYRFRDPRTLGSGPAGRLLFLNGTFYGTTAIGGAWDAGTVFSLTTDGTERVLHSFGPGPDGLYPHAGLTALNGIFYGTTGTGGTDDAGTVFSITTDGNEIPLYSFQGSGGGPDGAYPAGELIAANGVLYGTTQGGGKQLWGTVFKITTSGTETVLHQFKGGTDGYYPNSGLIALNGKFYGATERGGESRLCQSGGEVGCGAVYEMTSSGKESVLYRFKGGTDGQFPEAPLVVFNGALYGTTSLGGANGFGSIFRVTTDGKESVLYSFAGSPDGQYPYAGLTKLNGTLYGMTASGGTNGYGTIFALTQ